MAAENEKYVHFLLDVGGRPPQRCRVSFTALALLEGVCIPDVDRHQSMQIFMKHRELIEAIAKRKLFLSKEPAKWVSIAEDDLTPSDEAGIG